MNAPLLPEVLLGLGPVAQTSLDLAAEGVQRYVWQSAFGAMLIEVRDGRAFVNGQRVLSMAELRDAGGTAAADRMHVDSPLTSNADPAE
ncbi:MAG: hypothetical protein QM722_15735 [Piscinibacter sp.]